MGNIFLLQTWQIFASELWGKESKHPCSTVIWVGLKWLSLLLNISSMQRDCIHERNIPGYFEQSIGEHQSDLVWLLCNVQEITDAVQRCILTFQKMSAHNSHQSRNSLVHTGRRVFHSILLHKLSNKMTDDLCKSTTQATQWTAFGRWTGKNHKSVSQKLVIDADLQSALSSAPVWWEENTNDEKTVICTLSPSKWWCSKAMPKLRHTSLRNAFSFNLAMSPKLKKPCDMPYLPGYDWVNDLLIGLRCTCGIDCSSVVSKVMSSCKESAYN